MYKCLLLILMVSQCRVFALLVGCTNSMVEFFRKYWRYQAELNQAQQLTFKINQFISQLLSGCLNQQPRASIHKKNYTNEFTHDTRLVERNINVASCASINGSHSLRANFTGHWIVNNYSSLMGCMV